MYKNKQNQENRKNESAEDQLKENFKKLKYQIKKSELDQLVDACKQKITDECLKKRVDSLLNSQEKILKREGNFAFAQRELERSKRDLKLMLNEDEINYLLVKREELTLISNSNYGAGWLYSRKDSQPYLDYFYPKRIRKTIKNLDLSNMSLESYLDLSSFSGLESLDCSENNFQIQDLKGFKELTSLEKLDISKNPFFDSLEHLKDCEKLRKLDISYTNINSGLEYLPEGLGELVIKYLDNPESRLGVEKICEELWFYGGSLKTWRMAHPKLAGEKWLNETAHENQSLAMISNIIPLALSDKKAIKEDSIIGRVNYSKVVLQDRYPPLWNKSSEPPLRLYNIKKGGKNLNTINIKELKEHVEQARGRTDIDKYATLSYVWGKLENDDELTPLGRKSLTKAIRACEHLGIKYLWIDQLCINQKDRDEKAEEVRKMRKCYGNGTVTLVSINSKAEDKNVNEENKKEFAKETLKKIINSQWFTRSWTFQEGYLSQQTIFMFDNILVDGRAIAQTWVNHYLGYVNVDTLHEERLHNNPKKFATPVGWVYYPKGYSSSDNVSLKLHEALKATKERGRGESVDFVYSILGLLPYGEQVEVKYKPKGCPECPNREEVKGGCQHAREEKQRPIYTKEELERVLTDVIKIAVREGYGEPLTWFGPRRNKPSLWWIPEVDEKGAVDFLGGMDIDLKIGNIDLTENFVKLTGSTYRVLNEEQKFTLKPRENNNTIRLVNRHRDDPRERGKNYIPAIRHYQGKALIDDLKLFEKNFWVEMTKNNSNKYRLSLSGTKEVLNSISQGDILVVPNEEQWKSNWDIAILVPKEGGADRSVELVEMLNENSSAKVIGMWGTQLSNPEELESRDLKKLKEQMEERELLIDMINRKVIEGKEKIAQYEAKIQSPLK